MGVGGLVKPGHSLSYLVFRDIYKIPIFAVKKKLRAFLCRRGSYVTPSIEIRGCESCQASFCWILMKLSVRLPKDISSTLTLFPA